MITSDDLPTTIHGTRSDTSSNSSDFSDESSMHIGNPPTATTTTITSERLSTISPEIISITNFSNADNTVELTTLGNTIDLSTNIASEHLS